MTVAEEYMTRTACDLTHGGLVKEVQGLRAEFVDRLDKLIAGQERQNGAIAANTKWRVQGQAIVAVLATVLITWGGVVLGVLLA